ncbi:MAG TPA: sigma-70 family RNA polymerase sigma factor [Dongiaceae bacterium]|nr:sigma-70 family RNA polymerase sigma factor [Dongiaceae bacterium]
MPPDDPVADITEILIDWGRGDAQAFDRLFPAVYAELRVLARRHARRGRRETLGTTALVHEAYLKLVDQTHATFENRKHFFAVAAKVMRRLVVDHARDRGAQKRGGGAHLVTFDEEALAVEGRSVDLLALDEALSRLEACDTRLARLVELRYFGGLTLEETAGALEISPTTVKRDWFKARAFLIQEMTGAEAK